MRREARRLLPGEVRHGRADRRAPSTRPPASCSRGRSGRSRTTGAAGRPSAPKPAAKAETGRSRRALGSSGARSRIARQRRPRTSSLACCAVRGQTTRGADPLASRRRRRAAEALPRAPPRPRAGRAARSPRRRAARAAGVSAVTSGVPHASAWNALFGITRAGLRRRAEDPERARPLAACSAASCSYSTHGDPLDVRRPVARGARRAVRCRRRGTGARARAARRRGSSRARAAGSASRRRAPRERRRRHGLEHALLRADEADRPTRSRPASCEEASVLLRVRDDDVRRAERAPVDGAARASRKRAGAEAAAVGDERVGERDERVEHHRRAAGRALAAGRSTWPG